MKLAKTGRHILAIFLLAMPFLSSAQEFPSELWHQGVLVTTNGDTIKGEIKYNLQNDAVQINTGRAIQTFGPRKIHYFEIFDKTIDSYRHFYALPYQVQENYEVPLLFEVLYEGQLSLLCREEVVTETIPTYDPYPYTYYGRTPYNQARARLKYQYYFVDKKSGIQNYNLKKSELYTFFKKHQKEVKKYIKKNNLKHNRMRDLVRVTAYYNALLDS
jgi:hypothetical protein